MKAENPSAFPGKRYVGLSSEGDVKREHFEYDAGMTLRDYFAIHVDQPGVSEIVSAAGYTTDGFWVNLPHGQEKFNDWWNGLPLEERCSLSAKVRFALADALLTERQKGNHNG